MQTRRDFLTSATVTLWMIPLGCSMSTGGGGSCDGTESTSSLTGNHTHTLCVPASDLSSPPANGNTYMTSSSSGHTHAVLLSMQQLQMIEMGQTVMVTTSLVQGHTHNFNIMKA